MPTVMKTSARVCRRVRDEQLAAELDAAAVLVPGDQHVHAEREHQ